MYMKKTIVMFVLALAFSAAVLVPVSSSQSDSSQTVQYVGIIKRLTLKGQVGGVPPTTLFKPSVTGLYRVAAYAVTTTPDTTATGSIEQTYSWFDGTASQGTSSGGLCLFSTGCWNSFSTVIRAQAGQPVTYTLSLVGGTQGNSVYSWFVVVEKL
jgi:hypothetical protein